MNWIGNLIDTMTGPTQSTVTKALWWVAIFCGGILIAVAIKQISTGSPAKGAKTALLAVAVVVLALLYGGLVMRAGQGISGELNGINSFGLFAVSCSMIVCNKVRLARLAKD